MAPIRHSNKTKEPSGSAVDTHQNIPAGHSFTNMHLHSRGHSLGYNEGIGINSDYQVISAFDDRRLLEPDQSLNYDIDMGQHRTGRSHGDELVPGLNQFGSYAKKDTGHSQTGDKVTYTMNHRTELPTPNGQHQHAEKATEKAVTLYPKSPEHFNVISEVGNFTCGMRPLFLKQFILLECWFICSFITIVLNKYILTSLDGDPGVLGEFQLIMTTIFGAITMYMPCGLLKPKKGGCTEAHDKMTFLKAVFILGILRFGSVVCSVVALKQVAVSFSETIKSSAPLFTVVTAYLILGEYSGIYVNLSLIPIMFGLGICTANELSFNLTGFIAAVSNNICDWQSTPLYLFSIFYNYVAINSLTIPKAPSVCVQNVFSKKLLSGEKKYSPLELQFYTSVAASLVQMPFWVFFMNLQVKADGVDRYMFGMLLFNSVMFYLQSLSAYLLMSVISPITFSVASTAKRAVLIWFSVLVFGNKVTVLSAVGTLLVIIGVFLYQRARQKEAAERNRILQENRMKNLPV